MTRTAGKASKASSEEDRLDFAVGSLCEFDDGKGHVFVGKVLLCNNKPLIIMYLTFIMLELAFAFRPILPGDGFRPRCEANSLRH